MFYPSLVAEVAPQLDNIAYDYLTESPCKKRPDTGWPCDRIKKPKTEGECLTCKWIGHKTPAKVPSVRKINRTACRFPKCVSSTAHPSYLCHKHRELIRKRKQRWRKTNTTEVPESFLFEVPSKKKWGPCMMEGCDETASRKIKGFGEFCNGHNQTAHTRIQRAAGDISIEDVRKLPNRSQSRRKK